MSKILATIVVIAGLLPVSVFAQAYPAKAIKIVVPFAVGGIADTFARVIAQKVQES